MDIDEIYTNLLKLIFIFDIVNNNPIILKWKQKDRML